ncbi:uncharacterized protein LOC127879905 isoform X2 [Dreissena polymorpha]|nr:uncharacterized protein LOC127879905 isoform X1 [Dreissena polymorpha]XP_052282972.1 uncharacterized protein LOC127879905 isoform X1 [Dreissena polymorpha]XP_052282973.1 uncharacterized protein LOC127879905 isoform X2 [Dreissena polymorpha]
MQVRDSADSDALKYQSTMSHLLPTAFQHIQSFMRYRPVGMIRPVEKDKNGFQDNFPSPRIIVQPNVYFPHDSLWHARPRKAGKSSGTATEERSPTTSSKTQKASLSSNPPTNPVRTDTEALPPSVTSMSFHQRRVSQPSSSDSEPSARDPDGPIIASQRNLRQQDDAVHRALMEAGGVVSAREEVYNGEIMATSGRLSEDEVQPVWPQSLDVTDTPSQISGSLMRELVYQQDPKGYESTVSLDKFSLRPAGRTEEGQRKKKSGSSVSAETVSLGQGRGHMQSHMTDEIKSNIPGLRTYQGVSRVQQFLGLPIETNKDGFSGSNYHTGRDPHQQNGRGGEFPVHTPYDRPVHQTQIVDVGLVVGRKTLSIGESDMSAYQDDMLKADASLSDVVDRPRGRRSLPVQSQNGSRRQRLQEMLQQQST